DRWLQRLALDHQPDLIHFNDYSHAALPWAVPTLVVGHSCVLSWHEAVRGVSAGRPWRHYRNMVAAGLRGATLVAAPTRHMLSTLDRLYGPLPARHAILNGRDGARFHRRAKEPFVFAA